tara:strand:- start:1175 stop:1606 length:432 start_codon:yes stop_codon:yes gene_type:complete
MGNVYLWVKVFHVMFVVAWMAGLLYLPRIFVYHSLDNTSRDASEVFKIMERRLYYYIMHPSAIIVWITGLYLAHVLGIYSWLLLKFFFVILLTLYHINLARYLKSFSNDLNLKSSKYYRLINEIPFLIMFFILIFVIIKPELF